MTWIIVCVIVVVLFIWLGKRTKGKDENPPSHATITTTSDDFDEVDTPHFLAAPQYDKPIPIWTGSQEFEFSYLNSDGSSRTRRQVTVKSIEQNRFGTFYFMGHCHLKNAERTFRVSRITTMVKVDGGKKYKMDALFKEVLELPFSIHPNVQQLREKRDKDLLSRFAKCAWEGSMDIEFDSQKGTLTRVMISEHKHPYFWFKTDEGSRYKSLRWVNTYIRCKDGTIGKRKFIHEHLGIPTKGINWE
ncbi:WYL domain-containing protein [Pseudodesulfovibrio sediminis]|uniref:WYL domain-containing protein n=1 Tax=Pseudodesulfovibrio sediminis TaxID=2810563 RepID=A0ABM7PA52_9BACT|nr:WYL domain-containing protein [Pseudodesulfovibrio sediminis]BCS89951.1 hypothetical protein PSDVSF_31930 [Pseudodesulfovibrio sediminis]